MTWNMKENFVSMNERVFYVPISTIVRLHWNSNLQRNEKKNYSFQTYTSRMQTHTSQWSEVSWRVTLTTIYSFEDCCEILRRHSNMGNEKS